MMLTGCQSSDALKQPLSKPLVLAHGASAGHWSKNSRNAVKHSLRYIQSGGKWEGRFHGIEVDLVLTKDLVPILAHDPWINDENCHRVDGKKLIRELFKHIHYDDLINHYECGGKIDPNYLNAERLSESILGFDEFLDYIATVQHLIVYLDVKIEPGLTVASTEYANAIYSRWNAKQLKHRLYIEVPTKEASIVFHRSKNPEDKIVLSYPAFYASRRSLWTFQGMMIAINTFFNPQKPKQTLLEAKADAISSPVMVLNSTAKKHLRKNNVESVLFTINNNNDFKKQCYSGATFLITDYPELGPC